MFAKVFFVVVFSMLLIMISTTDAARILDELTTSPFKHHEIYRPVVSTRRLVLSPTPTIDRLVPGGPNPMEPPPTPTLMTIDRLVPGGPNPMEPPPTPMTIDRLVPGGPNPMEPPPTPTLMTIDRLVPGGPNPMEPPPTPTLMTIDRLVPGGPNPMEPPPTPIGTIN
ncbi:arp2/3 complex-activating protein rickA-like [Juglans regia]|uniref:Arp2/3 complex-activating protein rickA-like n=1 Tax=Juglans regia TaxID=51240 RepID=A0A6P9F8W0_JUGRE|nr:arp2/3 complex-activating protein rickA-like [Juglans regia]